MPVVGLNIDERFCQTMSAQTRANQGIAVNVRLVVVINEIVPERLPEDDPDQGNQHRANRESNPTR
jgi:hypothetical protein